jgi:DNA-binding transcriptional MerR regulator
MASVSIRTLRYYDRVGLLTPSYHTEAGYRLYTDEDLVNLQYILALKFLGFSLEEIQVCLRTGPMRLQEVLAQQRAMMREKRMQLDTIIQALDKTEQLLDSGQPAWESLVNTIQVIQMEQKQDWHDKYFTPEQRKMMQELSDKSYTDEARQRLKELHPTEWTEADQERINEQYALLASMLKRLVAEGADPASPDAQAAAKLQHDLYMGFTKGDAEVGASLKRYWQNYNALPDEQKPPVLPYNKEEGEFLKKALSIYQQENASGQG